jgi:hypothetical protein
MTTAFSATEGWSLALDLLVARSVLDTALRAELLAIQKLAAKRMEFAFRMVYA